MKSESNRPVTIEDLLRLKRAERPPAEFWSDFDRKLRAKQLAALVEKRPWWHRLPQAFSGFVRYRVPLGAAAAIAVTVFSLQMSRESQPAATPAAPASVAGSSFVPAGGTGSDVFVDSPAVEARAELAQVAQPEIVEVVVDTVPSAAISSTDLSRLVALGGGSGVETLTDGAASALLPANLAMVQSEMVSASRLLGTAAHGFESRAVPARVAVEPLQQMTSPSDSRRSRFTTAMVSTAALETSVRTTTERAANRIAEDQLYDQTQRFGARADRFNLKF